MHGNFVQALGVFKNDCADSIMLLCRNTHMAGHQSDNTPISDVQEKQEEILSDHDQSCIRTAKLKATDAALPGRGEGRCRADS